MTFRDWFYETAKAAEGQHRLSNRRLAKLVWHQAIAYIKIHRRLLRRYECTGFLPPGPSKDTLHLLEGTINSFLDARALRTLKPIFKAAFTLQGYGHMEEESILYGLLWVTPSLLIGLLEQLKVRPALRPHQQLLLKGRQNTITILRCGFEQLFRKIVEKDGINVLLNVDIDCILRYPKAVRVAYRRTTEDGPVDEVIM